MEGDHYAGRCRNKGPAASNEAEAAASYSTALPPKRKLRDERCNDPMAKEGQRQGYL